MKLSDLLNDIDQIVEKEKYEKRKKEIFDMTRETADELYVKSCGDEDE